MQRFEWELARVERLPKEQQVEYFKKLIAGYKTEIKNLKEAKKTHNLELVKKTGWRVVLIGSMVSIFAGTAIFSVGEDVIRTVGGIVALTSYGSAAASLVAMAGINDDGPEEIQAHYEAALEASEQIEKLKEKIRMIKERPAMSER